MQTLRASLVVGLLFWASSVSAQHAEHDNDVALWYARYAVHESARPADEVPLWEVLKWRASGPLFDVCRGDLLCTLHKYAAGRLLRPRSDRTRAIVRLNRAGDWPGGTWIAEAGWDRHFRAQWLETLARADRWYGNALTANERLNCRYRPHHWGGMRLPIDRARANRAILSGRWRLAECEDTSNAFFCVVGLCERVR